MLTFLLVGFVMRFVVYIPPVPKARPRFNPFTKKTYTSNETATFENKFREEICFQLGSSFEYPLYEDIPICVDLDFVFSRPKVLKNKPPKGLTWYNKRPDIDNLQKIIYDSLSGILWKDDKIIVDGRNRKFLCEVYGEERVCLNVYPAGDPPVVTCDFTNNELLDKLAGRKIENK